MRASDRTGTDMGRTHIPGDRKGRKSRRLFVPSHELAGRSVFFFSPKDSHYLRAVLRLQTGDQVEVFDGIARYAVRLGALRGGRFQGDIIEACVTEQGPNVRIALAFACVRPAPFQEILRHGTELGVSHFIPLLTQRTTRRPTERRERWETIVKSACAQSGRCVPPQVEDPLTLDQFICRGIHEDTRLLLSPAPQALPLLGMLGEALPAKAIVLVGPEGGLEPSEESLALGAGFVPVSLGTAVLRTETAASIAVGMLSLWAHWECCRDKEGPLSAEVEAPAGEQ
ncbi:MAG: 16S rRNA (uracil(1498)-N(3))-methyltransferase [Desulfomonile tiedjei]|nr:16S rRNA (uracil(1498)-N(3))-methyltransferase [Desulfomonile tiedjei]